MAMFNSYVKLPKGSYEQGVNGRHLSHVSVFVRTAKKPSLQHDTVRVVLFELVREIALVPMDQHIDRWPPQTSHKWGYTMIYWGDHWEISPRMYNFIYGCV
jgi:hypothetical protein